MSGAPLDTEEFQRWRDGAYDALESARPEAAAGAHNWSCFLAEQSAQLAFKALLHGLGKGPWGHDLIRLGREAEDAGIEAPSALKDALARLARHYIPARYPDAHPAGAVSSRYRAADSSQAVADAQQALDFVDAAWRSVHG
ncbi:MAG: HEPN domain-containing protein [Chloroflexota bacterium]|nr:HEPN domain-containing protein [Chloroflexota bacterium]